MLHFSTIKDVNYFQRRCVCVNINIYILCFRISSYFMTIVTIWRWYRCMFIICANTSLSIICFQVDYPNGIVVSVWYYISEAFSEVIITDHFCDHWIMSSMLRHTSPSGYVGVVCDFFSEASNEAFMNPLLTATEIFSIPSLPSAKLISEKYDLLRFFWPNYFFQLDLLGCSTRNFRPSGTRFLFLSRWSIFMYQRS